MATRDELVPKFLHTERLTLELHNHSPEHSKCLLEVMNTKVAHERMGDLCVRTVEEFDDFTSRQRLHDERCKGGVMDDVIFYPIHLGHDSPDGKLIGAISLSHQQAAGSMRLPPHIGWCMYEEYMGKGYAPEAAKAVLRWATEDFGIEVVVFPSATNQQSNRVAEKLGFVDGGQFPDVDNPGRMCNILILPGMKKLDIKEGPSFVYKPTE